MNRIQRLFEISSLAEPQIAVRTDIQPHLEVIGELINALLAQLDVLQYQSSHNDDVPSLNLREEVRRFEINLIQRALTRTRGSQVEAAKFLGLNATTLNAKLKRYHLHYRHAIHFAPSQRDTDEKIVC